MMFSSIDSEIIWEARAVLLAVLLDNHICSNHRECAHPGLSADLRLWLRRGYTMYGKSDIAAYDY